MRKKLSFKWLLYGQIAVLLLEEPMQVSIRGDMDKNERCVLYSKVR